MRTLPQKKPKDNGVEQAFQACGKAAEEIGFSRCGTGSRLHLNEGCAEL